MNQRRTIADNDPISKGPAYLTFINCISDYIMNVLNKYDIKIIFIPPEIGKRFQKTSFDSTIIIIDFIQKN